MTATRRPRLRARIVAAVLAATALTVSARAGEDRWTSIGPVGGGGHIFALAVDPKDPATVYAGYSYQSLWKTTDGGATWFPIGGGLTNWDFRALAVARSDPSTLYAATSGGVYRSTDAGATWQQTGSVGSIGSLRAIAIDPSTPTTVYAGGGDCYHGYCTAGGVSKTTDGGATWLPTGLGGPAYGLVILPGTPQTLFALGLLSLMQSTDGGTSWAGVPSLPAYFITSVAVAPGPPQTLYVATYEGEVFRSTDSGATWQKAGGSGLDGRYVVALLADALMPATVYAAASYHDWGIYRSTDGGDTWAFVRSASSVTTLAAPSAAHGAIWAATDGYGLFRSDPTGVAWSHVSNVFANLDVLQIAIDPGSPSRIYALAQDALYRTLDAGATWTILPLDQPVSMIVLDPLQSGVLYAGLSWPASGVLKSTDGGSTWTTAGAGLPSTDSVMGLGIDPVTPSTLYAGTYSSGAFRSIDGGASWTRLTGLGWTTSFGSLVFPQDITSFAIDPRQQSTIYASSSGTYKSTDAGESWRPIRVGFRFISIDPQNTATLWGTGPYYAVWKSVDGGESWLPAGSGLPAAYGLGPVVLDPVTPSTAYIGTYSGVFRTEDGGATWSPFNDGLTNPSIGALAVAPGSPSVLYAGTRGNSVFQLTVQRAETSCSPGATTFCLGGGRFRVETSFRASPMSSTASAHTLSVSSETGGFWFFDPDNLELVVKVLDGRSVNGKFWVFYGALTNVEYTITVTDAETGATRTYFNPQGQIASVADTSAF